MIFDCCSFYQLELPPSTLSLDVALTEIRASISKLNWLFYWKSSLIQDSLNKPIGHPEMN
jgi:hypothetical protein